MLKIERPWDRQPTGTPRLSAKFGAIAAALPGPGFVQNITQYSAERFAQKTGTNVDVAVGQLGHGAGASALTVNVYRLHSVANAFGTVWEKPSAAVTVLAYLIRTGNAAGNAPIFSNGSPDVSPFTAWGLVDASGAGTARFECSAGATYRSAAASVSIPNNTPVCLVGRYNGAAAQIFQDGVSVGSTACSGALTYPSGESRGPALGNFWNYTVDFRALIGRVFVAALWDRALSDFEIATLSRNPWQLFAPRRIWVPVTAAPTGPTVTALLRQRSQFIGSGLR